MMLRSGVAVMLMLVSIYASALAADLKMPPLSKPKDLSVHINQPNCTRWTDECVNCERGAEGGAPVCSNVGIACQAQAIRCLDTARPEPKTK